MHNRENDMDDQTNELHVALQAAAKAVLAMQQKPPDPPAAAPASAPAPGQDREAALALSGEEAFARRAMYVSFSMTAVPNSLTVLCMSQHQDFCMNCELHMFHMVTLCAHAGWLFCQYAAVTCNACL